MKVKKQVGKNLVSHYVSFLISVQNQFDGTHSAPSLVSTPGNFSARVGS